MSDALEAMREFVRAYPGADILSELAIDYTDSIPNCGGLFPSGLVEVARRRDILGNASVDCQYNFALYAAMEKAPGEDEAATYNASWLMGFQEWVQAQSMTGQAPSFGDDPRNESITAQNGALYSAEDGGTALYVIQISAKFTKNYGRKQNG
ncbi:MAG: hypothetical protein HFJ75_07765 [Eggerthellaceae bacterium]|nr:hypothetical protein [Eggerthellaceae bacterium]